MRGEFVWSLQGGAHAMILDGWVPRSMRASAPRPLALAGVTRTKSISDPVAITISVLSWCRPKGDKTLLDRCSHNNHIKRCVVPLPALFSVPPWIHHLTGISMHLVFQGFPSCLFPGVPRNRLHHQSLPSMHPRVELCPGRWLKTRPRRRPLWKQTMRLVSQYNSRLVNHRRLKIR